jgi:acetyltransferase-like isoleucine patch superfamily enzyme
MSTGKEKKKYTINAERVIIGENCVIEEGVVISGIRDVPCRLFQLGDNCYIGNNVLILTHEFTMGDYGTIHKFCRVAGYKTCNIGHNFWMDNNCILNCTDTVTIGDNVGVSAYSQLWSHMKYGCNLAGCTYNRSAPLIIEDEVTFAANCLVASVHAKTRSVALMGAVVTQDMESDRYYGGTPAVDITDKLGPPYIDKTPDERYAMMEEQIESFLAGGKNSLENIEVVKEFPEVMNPNVSYFNVSTRTYTKRLSKNEIAFMHHLLPLYKFTPV